MSRALELKVVFAAIDKFVRPAKAITGSAKDASQAFKANRERIKELDGTIAKIDAFQKVEKDAAIAANALNKNQRAIDDLKGAMKASGAPTKAMTDEMAKLTKRSEELGAKQETLRRREIDLRAELKHAKVDTSKLQETRQSLAAASADAAMSSRKLQAELDAENEKMRRLHAAQADLNKSREQAAKFAKIGAGMVAAGAVVGAPLVKVAKDYAAFETAMVGVARQMEGARDENGQLTASYREMESAIKALSERVPNSAAEIAKVIEGGAGRGITGKETLLDYAEASAAMAMVFGMSADQVGNDLSQLALLYKLPVENIRQMGDAITSLDINAQSNGGDIIDIMKRLAGSAEMAKMSFRDVAALGSTFLSIGVGKEQAGAAAGTMLKELSVAGMQKAKFQEGLAMLGLSGRRVQAGMAKDGSATLVTVLERIRALKGDKQLEAATRLFGKEVGVEAVKLAGRLDEYRKQLTLVREENAFGAMQREIDNWGDTVDGRIDKAKAAFGNLSSDLGEHLKPTVADALESVLEMIQGVRRWAAENPALTKTLMETAKWLAIGLSAAGALVIGLSALAVPVAMLKFSLVTLGISGALSLGKIVGGVKAAAIATRAFTLALLANPIGIALTAIATAATLIVIYWDPIKKFFGNLWSGITTAAKLAWGELTTWFSDLVETFTRIGGDIASGLWNGIRAAWAWVKENAHKLFTELPGVFVGLGANIADGMLKGITGAWGKVKDRMTRLVGELPASVKKVLGIRSPSRVFAEIGGHTMAGLEKGLEGANDGPLSTMRETMRKLAGLGAGIALGATPLAAMSAGMGSGGGNTYHITINAPAGADNAGLASLVAREIERIEASRAARQRSRLRDTE